MLPRSPNLDLAPCTFCGGSGWESIEGKGVRPCRCRADLRYENLLAQAHIPRRFQSCSFENFEAYCQSMQRALMFSRKFVDEYPLVDVGILYQGSCGVGKTHLAISMLKALIKKGIPGLFYDFRDLLKEIQDSFNPNTHTSELKILTPVLEAEILVLDELGASKPTEWVQETITHIINRRYNERRITIFTTNYLDMSIGTQYSELLTDRIGVRIRSRLHEMCRQILMEGEEDRESDYRKIIQSKRGRRFSQ